MRQASPRDAYAIARLIDVATAGAAALAWSEGDADPYLVGAEAVSAARGIDYIGNSLVLETRGRVVALLFAYCPHSQSFAQSRDMQWLETVLQGWLLVGQLAVLPPYRRLGYGTRLLFAGGRLAKAHRLAGLGLTVRRENTGARAFYKRRGFFERGANNNSNILMYKYCY